VTPEAKAPFRRRAFFEDDGIVGARWWQEGMAAYADPVTRRSALRNIGILIAGAAGVGIMISLFSRSGRRGVTSDGDGGAPILRDALDLQKEQGWDVGRVGDTLAFPGVSPVDAVGSTDWASQLAGLADSLTPVETRLRPFYVPTLFQSPSGSSSANLRAALGPIHDDAMDEAYSRGAALAALFAGPDAPAGTAVLVDAPGPIAVSVAAGMASRFDPVFLFDNWPHPAGVVPSHLALAATLYWLPVFQAAARRRAQDAPPVFVADDARLSPYTDASDRFDNRYLLRLPSAASLTGLGIKRLLLVRPHSGQVELDDLNDDVVAFARAGIEVKIVALDEFTQPSGDAGVASATAMPTLASPPVLAGPAPRPYYWGGSPYYYVHFWPTYGWSRTIVVRSPSPSLGRIGGGATYTPAPRPTIFSGRTVGGVAGVGRTRPTGFGVVSVRSSGEASGRSGSWGRAGSSSSSGS